MMATSAMIMTPAMMVAFGLQWVMLIILAALVLVLLRQVGLLHERLGPAGALTLPGGLAPGDPLPAFDLVALDGTRVQLGDADGDGKSLLLFFVSPTCPLCKALLPAFQALARLYRDQTRFMLASDGDAAAQRAMIAAEKLSAFPLLLSAELGRAIGVSRLPYAALIGADGRLIAKGLVNSREHLESLFEAERLQSPSLQAYLSRPPAERERA